MATITFNCPKCNYLCAFKDIYVGRRARCLRCDQVFIIPQNDGAAAQKIKEPKEFEEPLPGFYEAVFKKSWPAIFNKQSLVTLFFILLLTAIKFFTIHLDYSTKITGQSGASFTIHMPFGWAVAFFVWGGIFWCYAEIVYATAFDLEPLPQIYFGGGFGYLAKVIKSFYSFFIALSIVLLPAIIVRMIGIQSKWVVLPFIVLGMFLFPMAVLTVSIGRDLLMLFRPDYFFCPVKKAFWHYLFLAVLFILVWQLQYASLNYEDVAEQPDLVILLHLIAVLAIQILAVFTMRVTGLFYRHFTCFFKW